MKLTVFPNVFRKSGTTVILYNYDSDGDLDAYDDAEIKVNGEKWTVEFVEMIPQTKGANKFNGAIVRVTAPHNSRLLPGSTGKVSGGIQPKSLKHDTAVPTIKYAIDPEIVVTITA